MITTIRHPIGSLLFPSLRTPVVLGAQVVTSITTAAG